MVSAGITTYKDRAAQFVSALREVQEAFGDGYLSAFPREHFDRLENLQPVWAPYYVVGAQPMATSARCAASCSRHSYFCHICCEVHQG